LDELGGPAAATSLVNGCSFSEKRIIMLSGSKYQGAFNANTIGKLRAGTAPQISSEQIVVTIVVMIDLQVYQWWRGFDRL
jgi:hypothetical protein